MRSFSLASAALLFTIIATGADAVRAPLARICYFARDSVEVNEECRAILAGMAEFRREEVVFQSGPPPAPTSGEVAVGARAYTGRIMRFAVEGHADDGRGIAADNALSVRRASAVARVLSSFGVPLEDLRLSGVGSSTPQSQQAGYPGNRRVVVFETY